MSAVSYIGVLRLRQSTEALEAVLDLPDVPKELAGRLKRALAANRRFLREIDIPLRAPIPDPLLRVVQGQRGPRDSRDPRQAARAEIVSRRAFDKCEWCGRQQADGKPGPVLTCSGCRATRAAELLEIKEIA